MEIQATCPKCGKTLPVDSDACGQQVNCPTCSQPPIIASLTKLDGEKKPKVGARQMALESMVSGILSLLVPCLGLLIGINAITLGHKAHNRAKNSRMAIAGLVMGYLGTVANVSFILWMFLSAMGAAQREADAINSINNLKMIGLAFKIWEGDNNDQFPFNVSQTNGGTLELCRRDQDGFEQNPAPTFIVMSNELSVTKILVCRNDPSKHIADNFASLTAANISYQLRTGTNVNDNNPQEILAIDPINGLVLRCDGSVEQNPRYRKK